MSTSPDAERLNAALRRSAVRAALAPSVRNTQPWRFHLRPGELTVSADHSRRLQVLDPTGRQMIISCGSALLNARVSLAASGLAVRIERFPDPGQPHLVARIAAGDACEGSVEIIANLDGVLQLPLTDRPALPRGDIPRELIRSLRTAADAEDSELFEITRADHRLATAVLSKRAGAILDIDRAYRAEQRAWSTGGPDRIDGLETGTGRHLNGARHDIPIPDFGDASGSGSLPVETAPSLNECLLLLGTTEDLPRSWLRAGEALERIHLEVTRHGFAVSPMRQVIEVPAIRAQLSAELGLSMAPHLLLRIGLARTTPATRRRRLVDVLSQER